MKAALTSDLYLLRGYLRFYLGFFILLGFVTLMPSSAYTTYTALFFPCFLATFTPFLLFPAAEQAGWESALLCAPIERRQMVRARYLLLLGLDILFLLFGLLLGWAVQGERLGAALLASLFFILAFSSLLLYVLYRWGLGRAQLIFFLAFALLAFAARMLRPDLSALLYTPLLLALNLLGLALLALSYRLSCRAYARREF